MESQAENSRFLLRLCHDLKSGLRGVNAHTQLLLRNLGARPQEELQQNLNFVAESAQALDRIVDRLAAYSLALQTNASPLQHMPASVLLRGALARVAPLVQETGAEVIHGDLPSIEVNPDRLIQVFEELLRNSLRFRGEKPPLVQISAGREGDRWQFSFRDNGRGVEPADLERIFRPLERVGEAGTGFGLAICLAVIEAHGGKIWAEGAPGGGLEVRFTLPA